MATETKVREYTAKLPFSKHLAATPEVYHQDTTKSRYPSDNFIISRDSSGNVLSRYSDLSYDLSPYSSTKKGKTKIPFDAIPKKYQSEAHWLWFICYRFGKGRNKNNYSVSVLYSRFTGFIKPLCRFAKLHNVSAIQVLETKKLLAKFIHKNNTAMFNKQVLPTLTLYHSLTDLIGFSVALTDSVIDILNKRNKTTNANKNQTELIPPRLYGIWLKEAWSIVEELENNSDGIKHIIYQLANEKPPHKKEYTPDMRIDAWDCWVDKFDLSILANSRGFSTSRRLFCLYLSDAMLICKGLIHFYSGMRDDEVLSLNYHCLQLDKVNNRNRARLLGNTTKYIGSKKQALWVTTFDIERVITVLHTIVEPIANLIDVSVESNIQKGETPCPLFLTTNYLISQAYRKRHPLGNTKNWSCNSSSLSNNTLFNSDLMRISEEDIKYLERFETERN